MKKKRLDVQIKCAQKRCMVVLPEADNNHKLML